MRKNSRQNSSKPSLTPNDFIRTGRWFVLILFVATSLVFSVNTNDSTLLKEPILFLLSGILLAAWMTNLFGKDHMSFDSSPPLRAFIAFLLISLVSISVAFHTRLAIESYVRFVCYLILLGASFSFFRDETGHRMLLRVLIGVTAVACLIGISQNIPGMFPKSLLITADRPTISTFGNSMYFAGFLTGMLPILISYALTKRKRAGQFWMVILILATLYVLIQTEARSAWTAAVLGILCFALLNFKTARARWLAIAGIICSGILVFLLFPDILSRRISGLFDLGPTSTFARRLVFYEGAWNAFLASPLIGHGIGNFSLFLPQFRSQDYWMVRSEDIVPHAHNEFLEILSETGALGLMCFIAIIILYFRLAWKALKFTSGSHRTLLVGFMCSVIAILLDNLASVNLRTVPVAVVFWLFMGASMGFAGGVGSQRTYHLPRALKKLKFLPATLLLIGVIWYAPRVVAHYQADRKMLEGNLYRYKDLITESSSAYTTTLAFDSTYAEAQLYLASNLAREGRHGEALDNAWRLLARFPYFPKARLVVAISSFELGDTNEAIRAIEKELRLGTSPQTVNYAAYLAYRSHRSEAEYGYLVMLLENGILSGVTDYVANGLERLSFLCPFLGRMTDCIALVERVKLKFSHRSDILVAVGDFYSGVGLYDLASAAFTRALTLRPGDPAILSKLGRLPPQVRD